MMVKHYITKYTENGILYAESWLQINVFSKRKIAIDTEDTNR